MSELYRSTTDPRAFPGPKPRSQQMKALRALSYGQSTDGNGIGDLAELRRSIADDGDTLPGRTRGESLEMVNKVIADAEGYDDMRIELSRRPALK